jgi:hypothetical protein
VSINCGSRGEHDVLDRQADPADLPELEQDVQRVGVRAQALRLDVRERGRDFLPASGELQPRAPSHRGVGDRGLIQPTPFQRLHL